MRELDVSARAYHRTLWELPRKPKAGVGKLARTTPARAAAGARVTDLAGADHIETAHLAEAIQYRQRWRV